MSDLGLDSVKKTVARKRSLIIKMLHDGKIIDPAHRDMIARYIERQEVPVKPQSIQDLTKQFVCSACSYSVVRNQLTRLCGGKIPLRNDFPKLMATLYKESAFLRDKTWEPTKLKSLAEKIQHSKRFHLDSKQLKPRILSVLLTGSGQLQRETENGLQPFYGKVERICQQGGEEMWEYARSFAKPIKNVGTALTCDFLKEIGFVGFVKIDVHMMAEITKLTSTGKSEKCSNKSLFLKTQEIAGEIGVTPFHLDKLLYVWGWAKGAYATDCTRF